VHPPSAESEIVAPIGVARLRAAARSRWEIGALAALLGVLLGLALPHAAQGARPLTTGFADKLYRDPRAAVRDFWFDRTVEAGAGIVRIGAHWSAIAADPPADGGDPGDPGYDFAAVDAAVRGASARGLDVLLTVSSAPRWAEGPGRPSTDVALPGTWMPDPGAYGNFARALAIRYSGSYRPSSEDAPLPRVRYFQAWNEPNLYTHLMPQWDGRRAASPSHYRLLLNAFYDAVHGVHADNFVLSAGTAPFGAPTGGGLMRPLRFWRELLCIKQKRRGGLRPRPCPEPTRFDLAAHHPITGAPRSQLGHRDDATIPDLPRVRKIVRKAERSGRAAGAARHPLWVTEIWWESNPPDPVHGLPLAKQARWIAEGLYLIWKHGIRVAVLLPIRDEALSENPSASLQSGVFFADATPKPSLSAVRFPFVTERRSPRTLTAWGRSPHDGELTIERLRAGRWRPVERLAAGAGEVFRTAVRASGPVRLRASVAGETSLEWHQRR
jgi:hypothetical protein